MRSLIVGSDDCEAESEELGASEEEASSPAVGPNDTSGLNGTAVGTQFVGTVGDNDGDFLLVGICVGNDVDILSCAELGVADDAELKMYGVWLSEELVAVNRVEGSLLGLTDGRSSSFVANWLERRLGEPLLTWQEGRSMPYYCGSLLTMRAKHIHGGGRFASLSTGGAVEHR